MKLRVATRAGVKAALIGSTILFGGIAVPALAQQQAAPTPDPYVNTDEHGVDLVTGRYYLDIMEGSIGPADGGLAMVRHYGAPGIQDNWSGTLQISGQTLTITLGKITETFVLQGGGWVSTKANGGTLSAGFDQWIYRTASGTQITYKTPESLSFGEGNAQVSGPGCLNGQNCGLPVQIVQPDGVQYDLNWEVPQNCYQNGQPILVGGGLGGGDNGEIQCYSPFRLKSITSNSSYAMDFGFESNQSSFNGGFPAPAWYERKTITFSDRSQASGSGPTVTYSKPASNVIEIDNSQSGIWRITTNGRNLSIRKPGRTTDTLLVTRDTANRVTSISDDGEVKNYSWGSSGGNVVVDMTDASGNDGRVISDPFVGRPSSATNATGNMVTYAYDANERLILETYPEGNYTQYTRDARGNITQTVRVGKPGSGIANITSSANYDASCTSPAKCNKPNYVVDARGNRTDYSYDSVHGQVTRVQLPAPVSGARPTTDYEYAQFYARERNPSGVLVNVGAPQWKPTVIRSCSSAATCAGSANERKVTIVYNTPNLLPSSVTVAAGNGTLAATTTFAYNGGSNLLSEDGPLPGIDDTTYYFYDIKDRRRGLIGPDPDGGGAILRGAARYTYNDANQVINTEFGTATGATDAALNAMVVMQRVESIFDAKGNKTVEKLIAGSTIHSLTQYSYDTQNRLQCTAVRMNPAVYASLPASACTLSTQGANGPDRISRSYYDGDDRLARTESGVGTSAVGNDFAATFTPNGQPATLTDGESNRTTYTYDGHDRLSQTFFPSKTADNVSDSGNYEQLSYDQNGNVTSRRLRDGQSIAYGYDKLNRLISKNLPGSEPDASYGYDLMSRLTSAVQGGQSLAFDYDARGRKLSETGPLGTVTYSYDAAGRRFQLTWPDGYYMRNYYLAEGSLSYMRRSGNVVMASWQYDPQGRPISIGYAYSGIQQRFGYDPLSRLSSLTVDLETNSGDNVRSFSYNPAGQIIQTVQSNDAYAFTDQANVDRPYANNGLNQVTQTGAGAGAVALSYDARGNLTGSGGDSYGYSSENLLKSASVGGSGATVTLSYDPLGRLSAVDGETPRRFLYDGLDLIGEYDAAGTIVQRYVHGPGTDDPLIAFQGASMGNPHFLFKDERGSVILETSKYGDPLTIDSYDEYGIPGADNLGRFQYTGQTWIPELGLYYYKARFYSPTLGRFLQTDPIGYGAGMNIYNYVGGDPMNFTDPLGLDPYQCKSHGRKLGGVYEANSRNEAQNICNRLANSDNGTAGPGTGLALGSFPGFGSGGGPSGVPQKPQCPLVSPTGNYRLGANADPRFAPELASILSKAFAELNAKGITPYITSGFRTSGDQTRMRSGASGSNPAARVSNHQLGLSVDLNTRTADFPTIRATLTAGGLTWGGKWRSADPPHFQLPPGGTRADPAQAAICEAENG